MVMAAGAAAGAAADEGGGGGGAAARAGARGVGGAGAAAAAAASAPELSILARARPLRTPRGERAALRVCLARCARRRATRAREPLHDRKGVTVGWSGALCVPAPGLFQRVVVGDERVGYCCESGGAAAAREDGGVCVLVCVEGGEHGGGARGRCRRRRRTTGGARARWRPPGFHRPPSRANESARAALIDRSSHFFAVHPTHTSRTRALTLDVRSRAPPSRSSTTLERVAPFAPIRARRPTAPHPPRAPMAVAN